MKWISTSLTYSSTILRAKRIIPTPPPFPWLNSSVRAYASGEHQANIQGIYINGCRHKRLTYWVSQKLPQICTTSALVYCKFILKQMQYLSCSVCPRSSYPFYITTYYIKWVTTSWTHSSYPIYIVIHYVKWVTTSWKYST